MQFDKAIRTGLGAVTASAMLIIGLNLAQGATASADYGSVAARVAVNVRTGPGVENPRLGVLYPGEKVEQIGDTVNGWTPVRFRGTDAWVSADYLSGVSSAPAVTGEAVSNVVLNVRERATTLSFAIGRLQPGETVKLTGPDQDGWTPVLFQGRAAWVATRYITVSQPAAQTVEPSPTSATTSAKSAATTAAATSTSKAATSKATSTAKATTTSKAAASTTQASTSAASATSTKAATSTSQAASTTAATTPAATATTSAAPTATGSMWTTTAVNVRTGPATSYSKIGLAAKGTKIAITGRTDGEWSEVVWDGEAAWMCNRYLIDEEPGTAEVPSDVAGVWEVKGVKASTQNVINVVRAKWSQIQTVYGLRAGSTGDHGNGYAADFMLPDYKNNAALGYEIAEYLRANAKELGIQYIIFHQHIWNISRASEGWRLMADRGSDTQNHMDHVHVSMQS
jgi:uncharacterized protein YgiM (DUF1202 family)